MADEAHILLVDDERDIREPLAAYLARNGYRVSKAENAAAARTLLNAKDIDLVLLDIMMPGEDGLSLTGFIRATVNVPVILLTAKAEETDRIVGLEIGADDYVTKPFSPLELLARIKAVLRRSELPPPVRVAPSFTADDLTVNFDSQEVRRGDQPVSLSTTEYRLLFQLVRNAGHVVPRETLLARVWGDEYRDQTDYLKVYVSRLRAKLEDDPERPRYIVTERGLGYRFTRGRRAEQT